MTTCREVLKKRYPYLDGELPDAEVERIDAHLATCSRCAARLEAERELLGLVASAGHEEAPSALRDRVRDLLAAHTGEPARVTAISSRRRLVERLAIPLTAAAVLALVVLQPGRQSAPIADGFAGDHVQHALVWPSFTPFPEGTTVPDAPELDGAEVEGLSRCVIEGRTYAHYIYDVQGERVSAYLPLDAEPPPSIETASIGSVTVMSTAEFVDRPGAVLVSDDLSSNELARVWGRS